jgi:hypothetical protein
MPGWITHMGIGYLFYRTIPFKLRDLRFFFLGAIFPDVASVIYVLVLYFLRLPADIYQAALWYFQPFHTPFMCLFVAVLFGCSFDGNKIARSLLIFSGSLSHFFLDAFQKHFGYYQLLGYPFTYANPHFGLFFSDDPFFIALDIVSILILILVLFVLKEKSPLPELKLDPKALRFTWVLLVFLLVFPLATRESFYASNFHQLKLFAGKENFEGRMIELGISTVTGTHPLKVEELGRTFILNMGKGPESQIKQGERISLKGRYYKGKIDVVSLHRARHYLVKIITSLAGGVIFIIYFFISLFKRRMT